MDELNQLMAELTQSISTLNKLSESLDPPTDDYTETDADRVVTITCRPNGALISIRIADKPRAGSELVALTTLRLQCFSRRP